MVIENKQEKPNTPIFQSQNWFILLLLCVFSLGIYFPIWYGRIRNKSEQYKNQISKGLIVFLFISTILEVAFLLMQIIISKLNLLGPAIIFSRIISWISGILGGLFSTISAILIIILAFQVREVIDNVYNQKNSSGIGTFFFNILYLQVRINNPNRKSLTNLQKNTRNDYKSLFLFALLFSALILLYSLPTNNAKLSIEEAASLEEGNFEAAYKVTILFDVPDKFLNNETGIIAGGEVLSGTLRKGMKTTINEKESRVNFIEIGHEYADSVNKGDEAAVGLTNLVSKDELKVGSIIYFNTS